MRSGGVCGCCRSEEMEDLPCVFVGRLNSMNIITVLMNIMGSESVWRTPHSSGKLSYHIMIFISLFLAPVRPRQ